MTGRYDRRVMLVIKRRGTEIYKSYAAVPNLIFALVDAIYIYSEGED